MTKDMVSPLGVTLLVASYCDEIDPSIETRYLSASSSVPNVREITGEVGKDLQDFTVKVVMILSRELKLLLPRYAPIIQVVSGESTTIFNNSRIIFQKGEAAGLAPALWLLTPQVGQL